MTHVSPKPERSNKRMGIIIGLIAGGMVGLAYAAVPLYQMVCKVTGFAGTPRIAEDAVLGNVDVLGREITVRFDANVAQGLGWRFKPLQKDQTVKIGAQSLAFFEATNLTDKPITGTATFNVVPLQAGAYFAKIDCFCFEKQTLQPGHTMPMPVS
jgi:cytochrome c oxidase assembly protein subunit 11